MADDVREHLESWLGLNRDFLWKVMNHKEKVDAVFRDRSVELSELAKVCDEVETYLDEVKDMLKKLYLVLYETQESIKKTREKDDVGQKLDKDLKHKKEVAEKKAEEEAELRRKMEHERIDAAAKAATKPAPSKAEPKPEPASPPAGAESQLAKAAAAVEEEPEQPPDSIQMPAVDIEIPEKIGGLVSFLGLAEWLQRTKPDDQKKVVAIMTADGKMSAFDILERDIQTLKQQFAPYCWKTANKLMRRGYDEIATGLLIKGLTVVTKKRDKEMLHIMYAKYFYRQRKQLKNAYDACINHCEKAIKSYMQDKESRPKPVAPFKLLTMIYEEKNDLDRIIKVCDRAITLYQGSSDESKVLGFLRIKDILEKKEKQVKEEQANPKS
jgi:hypothetical protein